MNLYEQVTAIGNLEFLAKASTAVYRVLQNHVARLWYDTLLFPGMKKDHTLVCQAI